MTLRSVYETCQPRPEVLQGELREELFAARLKDVLEGRADPVYQDPQLFFDHTYPTTGLRTLLREALGRLTGQDPTANAIIRLETPFGGGKTHNLIALYHAARGAAAAAALVGPELLPPPGALRIAGVVGSELDPSGGVAHPDVRTFTLWGELAYQLGGLAGYRLVEDSDRTTKAAPGSSLLDELIGEQPTLIMFDEIARYLRAADAVPTATGRGTLADQTIAFLMSLLEFAASRQRVVVVLTLADPSDAFGQESEAVLRHLSEASHITARSERVLTPASEEETPSIVAHRLFRWIDRAAARETAEAYLAFYRRVADQEAPLPDELTRADYAERMQGTYPFHPELLRVLSLRVATIPNFQRTRGALRLLALVVRRLWTQRLPALPAIHAHHIDLSVPEIVEDLTSRLDRPLFKQVIEADIASRVTGQSAHAEEIDAEFGGRDLARRLATTIFLHSLAQSPGAGVEEQWLLGSVLEPGDDPVLARRALDRLLDRCWYLADDGRRFRFGTEVQLPKLIADEKAMVSVMLAKGMLEERIRQVWRPGALQPVFFPNEPAEVPDDTGSPKLVIVHFDAAGTTGSDTEPPEFVRRLFELAGASGTFRRYRNNLVFLVADREQRPTLIDQAKQYLAIDRLVNDPARASSLTPEQKRRLREMRDQAELSLRIAITRAYRYLFYPASDGAGTFSGGSIPLAREILPPQDQGQVKQNQTEVVVRVLRELDKLRLGDDSPPPPAYVRARAWEGQRGSVSTEDIRRAFAQRVSLPMIADPNLLKRTIRDGIRAGEWVYYAAREQKAYDRESREAAIELSEETFLYTPEEAARVGLPLDRPTPVIPPPKLCPVCRQPVERCTCGIDKIVTPPLLRGEGPPGQAFQAVVDACRDEQIERLQRLTVKMTASDQAAIREVRALGVVVSQLERGRAKSSLEADVEFGEGEQLRIDFTGYESRARLVRHLLENLGNQARRLYVSLTLQLESGSQGWTLDEVAQLGERFAELLGSRIELEGEPMAQQRESQG